VKPLNQRRVICHIHTESEDDRRRCWQLGEEVVWIGAVNPVAGAA